MERGQEMGEFIGTIIDAVMDIARGGMGGVPAKIEASLSKAVPLVISFLAGLLGLGGISEKVKAIFEKAQGYLGKAIDWVVDKGLKLARPLIKLATKALAYGKKKYEAVKGAVKAKYEAVKGKVKAKYEAVKGKVKKALGIKGKEGDQKSPNEEARVKAARASADTALSAQGATVDSVGKQLPGIKSEHKLAAVELRPGKSPNAYHIHVQTMAADTPDRTIGQISKEEEIRQSQALVGKRVLLTQEDVVAVVEAPDASRHVIFCRYELKQGRGQTRRGFNVSDFLKSYNDTHELLKPHDKGTHQSRYAIEDRATSTFILAPEFRKKWRTKFYGKDYGDTWNAWKERRLTTSFGVGDGLRHPEDKGKHPGQRWNYEGTWWIHAYNTTGEATLDHEPPVVSNWNTQGNNTNQDVRKSWFKKGPFEMMPRSLNSSYGSEDESTGERVPAQWTLGEEFLGPGESKR